MVISSFLWKIEVLVIISRAPYRVSFFGGGTDYHAWYQEHGGAILSTSINHYCYITCRYLPPFFDFKNRISWSKIEQVNTHQEINHPVVGAVLDYLKIEHGVEIHHQGDLPARSGLGSSSAFTASLLNALYTLEERMVSKKELSQQAIHVERGILKETVGVQDQIASAYGGFNKITILPSGDFQVQPVIISQSKLENLQSHLLLFFTGVARTASEVAQNQVKAIAHKQSTLHEMAAMVDQALNIVINGNDILDFGRLLHETWQLKRSLSESISPTFVDEIYDKARNAGAIGGKLLGAGGGGFMLFFAKPEDHPKILEALHELLWVPFKFESEGARVIFYDKNAYSVTSAYRRDFIHLKKEK